MATVPVAGTAQEMFTARWASTSGDGDRVDVDLDSLARVPAADQLPDTLGGQRPPVRAVLLAERPPDTFEADGGPS